MNEEASSDFAQGPTVEIQETSFSLCAVLGSPVLPCVRGLACGYTRGREFAGANHGSARGRASVERASETTPERGSARRAHGSAHGARIHAPCHGSAPGRGFATLACGCAPQRGLAGRARALAALARTRGPTHALASRTHPSGFRDRGRRRGSSPLSEDVPSRAPVSCRRIQLRHFAVGSVAAGDIHVPVIFVCFV